MKSLILILACISLYAHDIWIEKKEEGSVLLYGHLHVSANHTGKKIIPYDPAKIKDVVCDGKEINVKKEYPLVVDEKCLELYILLDNGYYTKTPYGTKNKPKDESSMALKSWKSVESVKCFEKNSKKVLSDGLEIVLLNDPKEQGQKARLQIFYHKKPIQNVVVAYDEKPRGATDAQGKVNVRLKHTGLQNIKATLKQKLDGVKADEIVVTTALIFELDE